jgi:hypothetical protein
VTVRVDDPRVAAKDVVLGQLVDQTEPRVGLDLLGEDAGDLGDLLGSEQAAQHHYAIAGVGIDGGGGFGNQLRHGSGCISIRTS